VASTLTLELDSRVYRLEAVQKASYRFIDKLTILISKRESGTIICEIDPVEGATAAFDVVVSDFERELLDQELRSKIKTETEPVRNLILAYAFSRSGLQR
jgi:His-Xaa-Ser system protein HxsD